MLFKKRKEPCGLKIHNLISVEPCWDFWDDLQFELKLLPVKRYIQARIGFPDGEDVYQEVLLKAWEWLNSKGEASAIYEDFLLAVIWTIARRSVVDYYRKKEREIWVEFLEDVAAESIHVDVQLDFQKVLAFLKPQAQKVVKMKIAGFTDREISGFLGLTEQAVKNIYYRSKLKEIISIAIYQLRVGMILLVAAVFCPKTEKRRQRTPLPSS